MPSFCQGPLANIHDFDNKHQQDMRVRRAFRIRWSRERSFTDCGRVRQSEASSNPLVYTVDWKKFDSHLNPARDSIKPADVSCLRGVV